MTDFTPIQSLIGGILIGLSAVLLMALHGRVAGMTGILTRRPAGGLRLALAGQFLAGAIIAPVICLTAGGNIPFDVPVSTGALIFGGLLVGIGVHFGNGCPSGHGICGLARFSPRSLAAVATFMLTAFATVFVVRHVVGG